MRGFVKTITAITLVSNLSMNSHSIAWKGNKMLVKEYYELEIANRPYKYQTKLNMVRCLKKLELWEMEYETLTPAVCWDRIDGIINQNVKRVYAGYVRNIFNYGRNQIPVVMGQRVTGLFAPKQNLPHHLMLFQTICPSMSLE
jgi:hypothetical protein